MALRDVVAMVSVINDLKRQRQQQEFMEQQARVGAFKQFASILPGMTNTQDMTPFIHQFAQESGMPVEAFRDLAAHYTPPSSDLNARVYGGWLGKMAETPMGARHAEETAFAQGTSRSAGQAARSTEEVRAFGTMSEEMRRQFNANTVAGMSAGRTALDNSLASMSPEELARANAIQVGMAISAPQAEQFGIAKGEQVLRGTIAADESNYRDRALGQEASLSMLGLKGGGRGGSESIEAARKRLNETAQVLTTKPHTGSGQKLLVDQMRQDFDMLYGPGSFDRTYPDLKSKHLSPGAMQRIFFKTGP